MKAGRENDQIILRLGPEEAQFMRRIFANIIRQYQLKPEEVHPRVAGVLYSTRGCRSAGLNEEQTREWIENLHSLKTANLVALRQWRRQLAGKSEEVFELPLNDEHAQTLVTVLNDHRLMCAARYNIGEEEMDIRTLTQMENMGPRQRAALLDVMLLGAVIETVLALLPGGYGDWPMYATG
jgi:hypothetical protein